MSEYTNRPWKVDPDYPTDVQTEDGELEIATTSGGVLDGGNAPTVEAQRANARLIAAAPEMFKALKTLRSFMWSEGYADQTVAMAKADAAIAKAEDQ